MALAPPGFRGLSGYRHPWLVKDLVAGVVLTTLLVPQGMAYAELADLPTITGLHTTNTCLLGYAVLGPLRILVLGPDSSLGPMIAATILPLVAAGGDASRTGSGDLLAPGLQIRSSTRSARAENGTTCPDFALSAR